MYKIKITKLNPMEWEACLYRRVWLFFWVKLRTGWGEVPITKEVLRWQQMFDVPDKRIIIY